MVDRTRTGELIWYRHGGNIHLAIYAPTKVRSDLVKGLEPGVYLTNRVLPWFAPKESTTVLYRHPIALRRDEGRVVAGPVFAILAGSQGSMFLGARSNFRDLMRAARKQNTFVYVLPTANVNIDSEWIGYVRVGYKKWIPLPCPHPEAVYNRVPNRMLERTATFVAAKERFDELGIPMFNPEYFNKAVIYEVIQASHMAEFLPETIRSLSKESLREMLRRHPAVYLKPTGGSVGHGILKVTRFQDYFELSVSKNGICRNYVSHAYPHLWKQVAQLRLPGQYVIQSAKRLLEWEGRPCDFRLLLQKRGGQWAVIGKGVRVSGPTSITTHVPNGGYIAPASQVLTQTFRDESAQIDTDIDSMAIGCADVIDQYYQNQLGEMSMDIGIDEAGRAWFFEANSKPMKFDEPDIRQKSLEGVIARLEEIRGTRPIKLEQIPGNSI